jgi:hypothetical protein
MNARYHRLTCTACGRTTVSDRPVLSLSLLRSALSHSTVCACGGSHATLPTALEHTSISAPLPLCFRCSAPTDDRYSLAGRSLCPTCYDDEREEARALRMEAREAREARD